MNARLGNERLGEMNYRTIPTQPIEIHVPHLLWVFIHQPDGGSAPRDGGLPTVLVSDCECFLRAKPTLVGREKLKVPLDVVHDCVLSIVDVGLDVIDVELQAAVDMTTQ